VKNCLACIEKSALAGIRVASIGPATSRVARMHGLAIDAEAGQHTLPGLASAIADYIMTSTSAPSVNE
ncbi:MAG: HemD protein, partial [Bryobacteraceae bacterium]